MLTNDELNQEYGTKIDFLSYHRIKTALTSASKKIHGIYKRSISDLGSPKLPIIHKISCLQSKGCRTFYQILRETERTSDHSHI